MATDEKKWLVVVFPCGCAPYANFQPEEPTTKKDAAQEASRIHEMVLEGAEVKRMTRKEALEGTTFLPMGGCPHTPKGWGA